jgi:hypothetical protein
MENRKTKAINAPNAIMMNDIFLITEHSPLLQIILMHDRQDSYKE